MQPVPPEKEEVIAPQVAAVTEPKLVPKKVKVPKEIVPKYYGTGRRKEAVARVCLKPGSGSIMVNNYPFSEYFCGRKICEYQITRPFAVTNTPGSYDVTVESFGGGVWGQAGAISLGIARALVAVNPDFKTLLKREGLLTRDPRMKERKKYGRKRARRAFQYTKR